MPPGVPAAPAPPIGIGIIGMPPVLPVIAGVATALGPAPRPDTTDAAIRAGVDPAQVGGTDIAPTRCDWPRPADTAGPTPPPPNDGAPVTTSPANIGTSAARPAV